MPYLGKYVGPVAARNVKNYQYRGSDNSILYLYVLNPIFLRLLEFIPFWMAPNLITLTGFLIICANHYIMWHFSPDLSQPAPAWTYVGNAIGLAAYQALDAIDGKQARRTGSSSPLGLLFDHGCDAMNITVSSLTLASTLMLGPTWRSVLIWVVGASTFFAATWEEYYTRELNLPFINGPNEGIWITIMCHMISAIYGPEFWLEESFGIQRSMIVVYTGAILAVPTILFNFYNVFKAVRKNKQLVKESAEQHSDAMILSASMRVAFTRGFPFVLIVGGMITWVQFSPSDIMDLHPRLVLWTCGLLVSKLLTEIMVAHICDVEYNPLTKTISVVIFVGAHAVYSVVNYAAEVEIWHEEYVLFEFFLLSLLSYAHLVSSLIWELTTILGIRCFVITPKDPRKNQ